MATGQTLSQADFDAKMGPIFKSMSELNDKLKNVTNIGERMEAVEKQLKFAQGVHADARQKVPVFTDGTPVQRDIFHEKMTKKELDTAIGSPTKDEFVKEVQVWSDTLKIHKGLTGKTRVRDLKIFPQFEQFCEKTGLGKALLNVVGSPDNFNPEGWSSEIQTYYQQELRVGSLFRKFPMPNNPYHYPFLNTGFTVRRIGEPTKIPAANIPASKPGQSPLTMNAKKYGGYLPLSDEIEEDAVESLIPTLRDELIPRGLAEADEDGLLNGDTAGTHQDAANTVAFASDDVRTMFLGIRAIAIDESATYDVTTDSTSYAYSDFGEVLIKGGKFGINPSEGAWVFSNTAYLRATSFTAINENPQLVGQAIPPHINGVVNVIHGRPVIVSEKYPEDLNASGVSATGSTSTGFSHVNYRQFIIGILRESDVQQYYDPLEMLHKLIVTKRADFIQLLPTGNTTCSSGINV